jgi:hypothetical protein
MGGAPKFEESQSLPEVSYADVVRTMGLKAIAVDDPDAVGPAWDEVDGRGNPQGRSEWLTCGRRNREEQSGRTASACRFALQDRRVGDLCHGNTSEGR